MWRFFLSSSIANTFGLSFSFSFSELFVAPCTFHLSTCRFKCDFKIVVFIFFPCFAQKFISLVFHIILVVSFVHVVPHLIIRTMNFNNYVFFSL